MMGRGDSWFWAILMPPKLQIWVVKTFPSSFLCMASKPGRGFRRMSLEMNKDKSFSGWEVQFRELGRGELVTQPKEKEAREMEMEQDWRQNHWFTHWANWFPVMGQCQ